MFRRLLVGAFSRWPHRSWTTVKLPSIAYTLNIRFMCPAHSGIRRRAQGLGRRRRAVATHANRSWAVTLSLILWGDLRDSRCF